MCQLLEKARENQGGISYYKVAQLLNTSDQRVRNWKDKKSNPNGIETLKLAEMAGVDIKEAIKLVEGGFIKLSVLTLTIGLTNPLSIKYLREIISAMHCILC